MKNTSANYCELSVSSETASLVAKPGDMMFTVYCGTLLQAANNTYTDTRVIYHTCTSTTQCQ